MMPEELDKRYDPASVETKWYGWWEEKGLFGASPDHGGTPYTIVIPPPNITGALHMGHALNNTLQDVLVRWKRMAGFNALWVPGTDHASIATEAVVTRTLAAEGIDKRALGREKFLERVWEWKREYGDRIILQLRRIGSSCDWKRTRFTMDEGLSRAVLTVFKRLYDEGLIYRGDYLVNWCPGCRTVLSNDEVDYKDIDGQLTYINYPIEDSRECVTVATTRPETMLGDTAVAMNPDDLRYQRLRGKYVILPLMERRIPLIEDLFVKPEFGTGLVKVTPGHDPNDYDMGRRHSLEMINILNPDGTINENGGRYAGLDRFEARKQVMRDLKAQGLIEKAEPYTHSVGHCDRSKDPIEPMLSKQWFVHMPPLCEEAIRAVEDGRVRFIPKNWENTYFHWIRNVRDWPISRQLWWGHRIPVWYCQECAETIVSIHGAPAKCPKCGSAKLEQDPDVLDTWFSSALWPFSTLGWPDQTKDLEFYYPTSTLVTDPGIIFLWVARMIISGLKFMGRVPFSDVYIHPVVMDEFGRKMSKSLGNGIDPLDVIEEYGTDSMRLTLCAYTVAGRNINLSTKRIEGYRNFINKLWNAARLVLMNTEDLAPADLAAGFDEARLELEDRWILSAYERLVGETNRNLDAYAFDQYIDKIYHFVWGKFCDWHLELVKRRLYASQRPESTDDELASRRNAQRILIYVLEGVCRLLHPAIPFVTEEIWHILRQRFGAEAAGGRAALPSLECESIMIAPWATQGDEARFDEAGEARMELVQQAIASVRQIRGEHDIAPGEKTGLVVAVADPERRALLERHARSFHALINLSDLRFVERHDTHGFAAVAVVEDIQLIVPLSEQKREEERKRLQKSIAAARQAVERSGKKLANPDYVSRAPAAVVEAEREKLRVAETELAQLEEKLKALSS
ncbi:MAG: valine--tRNA ligase [Candidatus Sumerlaeota bacterium]|nr:valine--tRNA ligase [Candidatus Sumerlaeota bacterium]